MRDLIVTLIVAGSLPVILTRPYIGILVWSWLGYMNPHRLSWSYAYDMPFAQIVGLTTLIGFVFTRNKQRLPINSTTVIWIAFIMWFSITTFFAIDSESSYEGWDKAAKIQLFSILTMMLVQNRQQVVGLVWVIVVSLGFFGLKGGLYVLRTGGQYLVYGPPRSFIEDNNALALALIMTLPLMWFLFETLTRRWQRSGMLILMVCTAMAILGSHSRGAALAGACMLLFFFLKIGSKVKIGIALILMVPLGVSLMPQHWFDRMETVQEFQQDNSAMGRITAWRFATELAVQRPIGGGFGALVEENYRTYSPDISREIDERDGRFQGAHSIYFRVLGEHGFFGLALFLALGFSAYRRANMTIRAVAGSPEMKWASDLSKALQVSLVGYGVGGAFLGLSYFDLFYHLIALVVVVHTIIAVKDHSPFDLTRRNLRGFT